MASKFSGAARTLRDFLVSDVKFSNKRAANIVSGIQDKYRPTEDQMGQLTDYVQNKFYAGFKTPPAESGLYRPRQSMEQFLLDNVSSEIFERGQRYGEMVREWNQRGFANLDHLDSYEKTFNSAARTAMRGQKVNFDRIGRKLFKEDMGRWDTQKAKERRLEEVAKYKRDIIDKNTQKEKAEISSFLRDKIGLDQTAADGVLNNIDPVQRREFLSTARSIYDGSGLTKVPDSTGRFFTTGTNVDTDARIGKFDKTFGQRISNVFDSTVVENDDTSLRDLILQKGVSNRMARAERNSAPYNQLSVKGIKDKDLEAAGQTVNDNMQQAVQDQTLSDAERTATAQRYADQSAEIAQELATRREAAPAPVGSGQTLGEEKLPALLNEGEGGRVSFNEPGYDARADNDPTFWGYKGGRAHHIKNVNERIAKYNESLEGKTPEQIAAMRKTFEKNLEDDVQGGYGISDWIFGNELHTGAIGAAAIAGTMGVAFGGHRSNADLYSSPF